MANQQPIYEAQAEVFSALAHPARLEILALLRDGEACVCHIQAMLDQRQAYISQHLNVLRRAGLVTKRKEGLRVYYQITGPSVLNLTCEAKNFLRSQGKGIDSELLAEVSTGLQKTCNCPQCASQAASSLAS
jgi:DNA-binding transcriptional ArsR family regulator